MDAVNLGSGRSTGWRRERGGGFCRLIRDFRPVVRLLEDELRRPRSRSGGLRELLEHDHGQIVEPARGESAHLVDQRLQDVGRAPARGGSSTSRMRSVPNQSSPRRASVSLVRVHDDHVSGAELDAQRRGRTPRRSRPAAPRRRALPRTRRPRRRTSGGVNPALAMIHARAPARRRARTAARRSVIGLVAIHELAVHRAQQITRALAFSAWLRKRLCTLREHQCCRNALPAASPTTSVKSRPGPWTKS